MAAIARKSAELEAPMIGTETLQSYLQEIRNQPSWRADADRCADYYDDKQVTAELARVTAERKQPLLIHNLIKPAINGILGLEAKTRPGIKLVADDDSGLDLVAALGQELNDAARLSRADRACTDAYAAMVKAGLGWVEVGLNEDPFQSPYVCNYIHRKEIWWDWHSKRFDLQDARWLTRRKWLDNDTAKFAFPGNEDLIDQIAGNWAGFEMYGELSGSVGPDLVGAYQVQNNSGMALDEWYDSQRRRVLVYETYYRVYDRQLVIKTADGDAFLYDAKNPAHVIAVAMGRAEVEMCTFTKMRLAFFIGPHLISDGDSPHPHNHFPYVPFFGYREDRTGIPYGVIRSMIPAQDEINHRRSKLTWLLNVKQAMIDTDALKDMSIDEAVEQLHLSDGVITTNPNRQNADGFRVLTDTGVAQQQFQVMLESQKMIQDVAGIYSSFLGQESGAKSGIAINSLVEQGTVSLAEINDNLMFARSLVHELLLAHVIARIGNKQKTVRINANKSAKTKTVVLNERMTDADGRQVINNQLAKVKARVVIEDVPSTPGYRQQMSMMLTDLVSKMPPEFQAPLIELVVSASDLDNREEVLAQIRKISGSGDQNDLSPEEQQAQQQKMQEEQKTKALQFQALQAKVDSDMATAKAKMAEAAALETNGQIESEFKTAQIQKLHAETKQIIMNIVSARKELVDTHINNEIERTQAMLGNAA